MCSTVSDRAASQPSPDAQPDPSHNYVGRASLRQLPAIAPGGGSALINCQAGRLSGGNFNGYSIENAQGPGLIIGPHTQVYAPHIYRATGDGIILSGNANPGDGIGQLMVHDVGGAGIVIMGDGWTISGGVIDGARGPAISIVGNNNTVLNIAVSNCSQPVSIKGHDNRVTWEPVQLQSESGGSK